MVGVSQPVSQAKAPLSPTLEDRYLELVSPKLTLRFNAIESLWALLAIWSQHTNTPTLNWKDFPSLPLHVLMCWMEVCKNLLKFVCLVSLLIASHCSFHFFPFLIHRSTSPDIKKHPFRITQGLCGFLITVHLKTNFSTHAACRVKHTTHLTHDDQSVKWEAVNTLQTF